VGALGHEGVPLKGSLPLFLLLPSHVLSAFNLPCIPIVKCCLITDPKQWDKQIMVWNPQNKPCCVYKLIISNILQWWWKADQHKSKCDD
jgi:hypothetical protein